MAFIGEDTVPVKKKDLRRLYRLTEDIKENNIPHTCPDMDETIAIIRRVLQMDRYDRYEPED